VRTRNRPADLRVALDSLASQTYRTFEVVVVNDGGEDISGVLEHYDGRLNLECVVNAQAHGRSQAVNDGVGAARGEYVTFLDDDDVLYPVHLSTLVNGIHGPGDREFVYSHYNHALIEGRGETATVLKHQHLPPWHFDRMDLLAANRPPIHTWLLRRETFQARGGFDPAFDVLHDWDFLLRVTEKLTLEGLPQETCEYRIYLDLDNSVTSGRQRILDDVRLIHERHPASSALVSLSRKLQIARFEFQVGLADELMGKVEAGVMTRDAAALAYIDAVFGFA
jgi:glycosyltransferase involved in cell wall biosynthesis